MSDTIEVSPGDVIDVIIGNDVIEISTNVIQLKSLSSDNYTGSDLTGAEGTGRTLVVTKTPVLILVERQFLHPTIDFTVSGLTITFNGFISDVMRITIYSQ